MEKKIFDHDYVHKEIQKLMERNSAEACILLSPENVYYSTGANIHTQRTIRDRLAIAVFTRKSDPVFIVCNIEGSLAKKESVIKDIRTYVEFAQKPVSALEELFKELNISKGKILVEGHDMPYSVSHYLKHSFPELKLLDAGEEMEKIRMIKSSGEIQWLQEINKKTVLAINTAFSLASVGDSQTSVAGDMFNLLHRFGADVVSFCSFGVGSATSAIPHAEPQKTPLVEGDHIRVDFGGNWKGFYSDMARMAFVGKPSPKVWDIYQKLVEIQRSTIQAMVPGVKVSEIYKKCAKEHERLGLPFWLPHIGHSFSLKVHEYPMVSPYHHEELQPNMVFNIEPFVIDPSLGGFHVEDTVLVTEKEPVILTKTDLLDPVIID